MTAPPPPEGLPLASRLPLSHRRARYYRIAGRQKPWVAMAGWTVWMMAAIVIGTLLAGYGALDNALKAASPNTPEVEAAIDATQPVLAGEPVNVLLIGSDSRGGEDGGRSDSLILMRLDADRGFISLLSFPRDLYVSIPGLGLNKINAAFSFGGAAKTTETVRELTGQSINHSINIDFDGFSTLVDEVGGVLIDVDRRYYNDNVGCSNANGSCYDPINLQSGYQRLDGEQALDYVRYRHNDGDFARIARQQLFLSELKRQTNQFGNLTRLNSFAKIFGDSTQTTIRDVDELLSIIQLGLTIPEERIARTSITGDLATRGGASVVLTYPSIVQEKVNEWRDPEFLNQTGSPSSTEPVSDDNPTIIVQNAGNRLLAGSEMAELLREEGYDATHQGAGTRSDLETSIVRYRQGAKQAAKRLQSRLGPVAGISLAEDGETGSADLLVLVGSDFTGGLYDAPEALPAEPGAADPNDTSSSAPAPSMLDTTGLVDVLRRVEGGTDLTTMAPLKLPTGSRVRRITPYQVEAAGDPWALKITMAVRGSNGSNKYFGMMQTTMKDPPILDGRTGQIRTGGREYFTYYDGKNMQRLAWKKDDMTFWISNTLDYTLSDQQMWAMAKSARPLGRAKLPPGVDDTAVSVELEGSTP